MIDLKEIRYDCIFYKGDMPCLPNKLKGKICNTCDEYTATGKRILLVKLGALGDVIRTTPLIHKLRYEFPGCHITWLSNFPEILPAKDINTIYKFDYNSVLIAENTDYDVVINLDKDKEACILTGRVRSNKKYGFIWQDSRISGLSDAANRKLLTGLFDKYSKENKLSYQQEIFEICGFSFDGEPNLLNVNNEYSLKWSSIRSLAEGKPVIGLNTGCGKRWMTRMWPDDQWLELINDIRKAGYYPVVIGGIDEHERNLKFSKETGAFYPGYYNLDEFVGIVNNCDVVVTAVSMAFHIASGLQKKIVLFNNIFNKHEFELYGKGIIIEPPSGCDCYYGTTCTRKSHCMKDINAEQVVTGISSLLEI